MADSQINKNNRGYVYAVVAIFLCIAVYVFAYEKSEYGKYEFKRNRFTGTVYIKAAHPQAKWHETKIKDLKIAIQWARQKEINDLRNDIVSDIENKLDDMRSSMEDR